MGLSGFHNSFIMFNESIIMIYIAIDFVFETGS